MKILSGMELKLLMWNGQVIDMQLIDINQCTNDNLVEWDNDLECWKFRVDIYEIPTVDAVEVVRCKDCKYFMPYTEEWSKEAGVDGTCWIRLLNSTVEQFHIVNRNDFCSYGERRDDD